MSNLGLAYKDIINVEGVKDVDYLATFSSPVGLPANNYSSMGNYSQIASFPNTSRILDEWLNNPSGEIPTNYTYVINGQ